MTQTRIPKRFYIKKGKKSSGLSFITKKLILNPFTFDITIPVQKTGNLNVPENGKDDHGRDLQGHASKSKERLYQNIAPLIHCILISYKKTNRHVPDSADQHRQPQT